LLKKTSSLKHFDMCVLVSSLKSEAIVAEDLTDLSPSDDLRVASLEVAELKVLTLIFIEATT